MGCITITGWAIALIQPNCLIIAELGTGSGLEVLQPLTRIPAWLHCWSRETSIYCFTDFILNKIISSAK